MELGIKYGESNKLNRFQTEIFRQSKSFEITYKRIKSETIDND